MGSIYRLPPLPALRDFINIYNLRAKKILSQNFLMDMNLNRKVSGAKGNFPCRESNPGRVGENHES